MNDEEYAKEIGRMAGKARFWRRDHPWAKPKIQFNYDEKIMLIAPIGDAIKNHFVSVNEEGQALIDAMNEGNDSRHEVTAFMVRMALDFLEELQSA